jgi:hypothetical protein
MGKRDGDLSDVDMVLSEDIKFDSSEPSGNIDRIFHGNFRLEFLESTSFD